MHRKPVAGACGAVGQTVNRPFTGDLRAVVESVTSEAGVPAVPVRSGLGPDDLPDLGGQYLHRLEPPRIALVARGNVSPNDFGATWFFLDQQLGLRHSHLTEGEGPADLGRYNVVVLPDRSGPLPTGWREPLKEWVRNGGTLIAVADAAADLASRTNELTKVRLLPDVLGQLGEYERMVFREWLATTGSKPTTEAVWTNGVAPDVRPPLPAGGEQPKEDELKQRDAWNRLFMPQGAVLASRTAPKHWLTFGCPDVLPVLTMGSAVLMSGEGGETPIRFGVFMPLPPAPAPPVAAPEASGTTGTKSDDKDKKTKPEVQRFGWSAIPEGQALNLRMSGLLWPEAGQRLANSAAVTREAMGRGQVILFANPATFRAATAGMTRVFANALVYGPGFGANQSVRP